MFTAMRTHQNIDTTPLRLAIVGGGAAGFFLALNVHELYRSLGCATPCQQQPQRPLEIHIFEKNTRMMSKLARTGHGRCNCTNTFAKVKRLEEVYPRGARLLKKLLKQFGPHDTYRWFEEHGIVLMVQDDQRIFPATQTS